MAVNFQIFPLHLSILESLQVSKYKPIYINKYHFLNNRNKMTPNILKVHRFKTTFVVGGEPD